MVEPYAIQVNKLEEEIEILKSDNASCRLHSEEALLLSEKLVARIKNDADMFSRRIDEKEHEIRYLRDECSSRDAEIQRLMKECRIKDKEIARCISQVGTLIFCEQFPDKPSDFRPKQLRTGTGSFYVNSINQDQVPRSIYIY
jgi:chromosome segregation ATPase